MIDPRIKLHETSISLNHSSNGNGSKIPNTALYNVSSFGTHILLAKPVVLYITISASVHVVT